MSNPSSTTAYAPAPTTIVKGIVERTNKGGLFMGGQWHNYGTTFQGAKLAASDVGSEVELTLVHTREGKQFVRSLLILAAVAAVAVTSEEPIEDSAPVALVAPCEPPKAAAPAPAVVPVAEVSAAPVQTVVRGPSEAQVKYANDLASKLGMAPERLDLLASIRFGKSFSNLGRTEIQVLIPFLRGDFAKPRSRR
jgi:hypothetical protein